ncbi:MAG TPA: LysM peptidoglycan-binding domain-containing protein [Planctomycetaceae bacterium]|nr:LysM peptidoglycan-binding domain-containing protein [Planctomycetaceae bacterium]
MLVLVGVFSFVAYRKYNEAKLHPTDTAAGGIEPVHGGTDKSDPFATGAANTADARGTEHGTAGFNGGENEAARGSGAAGANQLASNGTGSSGAPGNASAFSQSDESNNPNAAFHPTHGGATAEQPLDRPNGGQSIKTVQHPPREAEINPFSDVASNSPSANASGENAGPPGIKPNPTTGPKPLGSQEARNDQSEPLFNEGAEKGATNAPPKQGEPIAASGRNGAPTQSSANAPNEAGWNDLSKPHDAGSTSRPTGTQLQPVQTAQSEPNAANGQVPPKQAVPLQTEPQSLAHEAAPTRSAVAPGSLLDQEEPAPATAHRDPAATGMNPSAGNPLITSGSPAQTAQASSATTVHVSSARPLVSPSDNEDLFAGKTADATPKNAISPIPQSQATASTPLPGTIGSDATLNEPGDSYVVQPTDTFWTISHKKYGTARYFRALAELNRAHVPDPLRMRPGVKVSTPPTEILETQYSQFLPKGSAVEVASGERPAGKSGPPGFFTSADGKPMYRAGEKDTLSDIAAKHLGRASRWIQVFEMNRDKLTSPNQVKVGTELVLPADASNVALTNENDDRR